MAALNLEQQKVRAHGVARPLGYAITDILVAKQCYHCQGLGHVQADCPTLRISGASTGGRCYSCGQPGHLAVSIYYPSLRIKLTLQACLPK